MPTKYEPHNADFSNIAHEMAQKHIYPVLFSLPIENLRFESTPLGQGERETMRDGEMAIDRIVWVTAIDEGLHQPLKFTIQERFRRISYAGFRDITITEWNHATNRPSELYKIEADFFVYGYFSQPSCPGCGEPLDYNATCKRPHKLYAERRRSGVDKEPCFWEWVAVDIPICKLRLAQKNLRYGLEANKKEQSFITIALASLDGMVVAHGGTRERRITTQPPLWEEQTTTV